MIKRILFSSSTVPFLTIVLVAFTAAAYVFLLPPEVPLLYTLSRSQDQIVKKEAILLIPLSALAVLTLNSVLGKRLGDDEFMRRILQAGSLGCLVLFYIAFLRILAVVV